MPQPNLIVLGVVGATAAIFGAGILLDNARAAADIARVDKERRKTGNRYRDETLADQSRRNNETQGTESQQRLFKIDEVLRYKMEIVRAVFRDFQTEVAQRDEMQEEIQAVMDEVKRDKAAVKAAKRAAKLRQDSASASASAKEAEEEALLDELIRENHEAAAAAAAAASSAPAPAAAGFRAGGGAGRDRPQSTDKTVQAMLLEHSWLLVRQKRHYVYKRTVKGVRQTFTQSKTPSDRRVHDVEMATLRRLESVVEEQLHVESFEQMGMPMLSDRATGGR